MSDLSMRHPSDEQLLRYADGELPGSEANRLRSHLETCWQCRTEFEELQKTIGECVHYRKMVWEVCLPPPPAPWADLSPRFAEMDASQGRSWWLRRMWQAAMSRVSAPWKWAPAAVAVLLAVAVVYQFQYAPSVRAASLLRKAVAAAETRPAAPRRIIIRSGTASLTRRIGQGALAVPASVAEAATLASLEEMFRTAHYDWKDPLSAKSYQAWRDQLAEKHDEVTWTGRSYQIHTTTESGELLEATLKLRAGDLQPIEETLQFRNQGRLEIAELSAESSPTEQLAVQVPWKTPAAPVFAPRQGAPAEAVPQAATLSEELQVFATLHRLGADLGDPVEVTRSGRQVLVSGVGVSPGRRQQIQSALSSLPRVVVQFSEPASAGVRPGGPASNEAPASPEVTRLQARLEGRLGGRASFQHLSDTILERSEAMMSRAYALRRLAERFPAAAHSQLSSEDRQLLATLRAEHATALGHAIREVEQLTMPALAAAGASAPPVRTAAPFTGSWQDATGELFRTAREAEAMLGAVFAGAATNLTAEELPTRLRESLTRLRAESDAYERLTRGTGEGQR
jgi:hypothetical protein